MGRYTCTETFSDIRRGTYQSESTGYRRICRIWRRQFPTDASILDGVQKFFKTALECDGLYDNPWTDAGSGRGAACNGNCFGSREN